MELFKPPPNLLLSLGQRGAREEVLFVCFIHSLDNRTNGPFIFISGMGPRLLGTRKLGPQREGRWGVAAAARQVLLFTRVTLEDGGI